jgi:hypothetical protein
MKKNLLPLAMALLALSLTACSTMQDYFPGYADDLAVVRTSFNGVKASALAYQERPLCGHPNAVGKPACSDIVVVRKIDKSLSAARTAITAAEEAKTQTAIGAARTAVEALTNIVNIVTPTKEK